MADFVHELEIAASPDSLRKLIAERGDAWWTTNALIDSQVGGSCEFRFPAAGFHASVRVIRNSKDLGSIICSPATSNTIFARHCPTAWGFERDDFSSNRHPALSFCSRMIFSKNRYPLFRIML
jgi:hypothetical protein